MNEQEFGSKIASILNEAQVSDTALQRLRLARREALERARRPRWAPMHIWVPAAALMLAVAATAFWQVMPQEAEVADIDVALLAGDLPVYAYVDKEFVRALD
jgi:hypothetical protein